MDVDDGVIERVFELECCCMQDESRQFVLIAIELVDSALAVLCIADDLMREVVQVSSNLVMSAGGDLNGEQ